jgi:hypothetical protein
MPATNGTFAAFTRFVSIAVFSCLLITGGLWAYHNRAELLGDKSDKKNGNWFTRWAGVDATKLKEHDSGFDFGEQESPFKTEFAIDPDWIQKMNSGVNFDWDSGNR